MGFVATLAGGLLGLAAAAGLGLAVIQVAGPVPQRWRLAISLISGVAIIDLGVMLVLFCGGGVRAVNGVGAAALMIGCGALWKLRKHLAFFPGLKATRAADACFLGVIVVVAALNLFIAVAPSTKIDELYYHMLIPKRIVEDGGVYLYHWPFEAAFFPQNAYQLGLTPAFAAGIPEAGNVISWGLGTALILLVAGLAADLTGNNSAGWAAGAIAAVGLYSSVWHVTSGPHALGDLAVPAAFFLAVLPDSSTEKLRAASRLFLVCLAAYTAASTKISILPLAALISILAVRRAAGEIGWKKAAGIALSVWAVGYGPIIAWTTWQCGSPLGLATAALFHSRYFAPADIARLADLTRISQTGWRPFINWLAPSVSVAMVAAVGCVAYGAWKGKPSLRLLLGLVCGQAVLIVWLLPHEFRFLGGLQYAVLVMGAGVVGMSRRGRRLLAQGWLVLATMCLPWLAVQVYYARPFLQVDLGMMKRDTFLEQYVAFTDDFRALDRILPPRAVIYVVNSRPPSFYAPRPVIFTLEDRRGRNTVYRFVVEDEAPPVEDSLRCSATVYEDPRAMVNTYRTPGRAPDREALKVERCEVVTRPPGP